MKITFYSVSCKLFVVSVLLLSACSKDDDLESPVVIPDAVITGISPTIGTKTSIINLYGSNFGIDKSVVEVFFNGKEAEILEVNDTQIKAIVPSKAFSGTVSLVVREKRLEGPRFEYLISDVQLSTFAGTGVKGTADGPVGNATFFFPRGLSFDASGNLFFTDLGNSTVRKISALGVVSTLAGSPANNDFADGSGSNARFNFPVGIAVAKDGTIFVADEFNHRIRKITPAGVVSTFAGTTPGFTNGTGTNARFSNPRGIAIDTEGTLYIADTGNNRIRKITPSGVVSTLAGSNAGFADATGTEALFNNPESLVLDPDGNLLVTDRQNQRIRKITPAGVVTTFAGTGNVGFVDGAAGNAFFNFPRGIAIDAESNVYIADTGNHRIRKISSSGIVSTLAGSSRGFTNSVGVAALFNQPTDLVLTPNRDLIITDSNNNVIRLLVQD